MIKYDFERAFERGNERCLTEVFSCQNNGNNTEITQNLAEKFFLCDIQMSFIVWVTFLLVKTNFVGTAIKKNKLSPLKRDYAPIKVTILRTLTISLFLKDVMAFLVVKTVWDGI